MTLFYNKKSLGNLQVRRELGHYEKGQLLLPCVQERFKVKSKLKTMSFFVNDVVEI